MTMINYQVKFMKKLLPASKGFTLIELLVVVTIIAFLAVIGAAAFGNVQKNARDAKRRADVDAVSKALEANKNADGTYKNWTDTSIYADGKKPDDPDSSKVYTFTGYRSDSTAGTPIAQYTFCAPLETTTGGNSGSATPSISAGWTGSGFYCRRNQQ